MGYEPPSLDDRLDIVWRQAQQAHRARLAVIAAIARARMEGASYKQLADASGLSERAVDAYVTWYLTVGRRAPRSVGRRPRRNHPPR